jgi:D-sedoheptulose 7-phosphate isomerase
LKDLVLDIFKESVRLKEKFVKENIQVMEEAIQSLATVLGQGNKIMLFGNGGSAADAQHIAAEFVNRYLMDRPPLPAMALTTDSSVLTSIANDFNYDEIFEKQIKALGKNGDAAVGISTSGHSRNVIRGLKVAREMGMITVGMGGPLECPLKEESRHYLPVEGGCTPRIQEVHSVIGHALLEAVDHLLFGSNKRI